MAIRDQMRPQSGLAWDSSDNAVDMVALMQSIDSRLASIVTNGTEPVRTTQEDSSGRVMCADAATHCTTTIDYPHHEIHSGRHFVVREAVDLAISTYHDVQITTPNTTRWAHMWFSFEVESETEFWVYENVTINVAGTALYEGNRNRNSDYTAGLVCAGITNTSEANANADTAVAGAQLLVHGYLGSGRTGGGSASREEVVLKQNEDYTVRFKANSAGYVNYQLDWYEHVDKEAIPGNVSSSSSVSASSSSDVSSSSSSLGVSSSSSLGVSSSSSSLGVSSSSSSGSSSSSSTASSSSSSGGLSSSSSSLLWSSSSSSSASSSSASFA